MRRIALGRNRSCYAHPKKKKKKLSGWKITISSSFVVFLDVIREALKRSPDTARVQWHSDHG